MFALRVPSFDVRLWLFDVVASYSVGAQELESGLIWIKSKVIEACLISAYDKRIHFISSLLDMRSSYSTSR